MSTRAEDKTSLTYWFPRLEAASVPVPKTIIVPMPVEAQESIWGAFDGKDAGDPKAFFAEIAKAAEALGYPCFLRTAYTSGKHNWERTCFLTSAADIPSHIFAITEYSEMAGIIGYPWDTWAVREMLPTIPLGVCQHFANMPICREFRFFVEDGEVKCHHPYWPLDALEQGGAIPNEGGEVDALFAVLSQSEAEKELRELASRAGAAVGGAWSIDILETQRGWLVTDMAEAHKSFHWESCERVSVAA